MKGHVGSGAGAHTMGPCLSDALVAASLGDHALIQVDAPAGSGKTTAVLALAAAHPERSMLQLTYNSALRIEVRQKAAAAGLANLEVHTFHSLAVKYFNRDAHTDTEMAKALAGGRPKLRRPLPDYDDVIVDETQDMTLLYFRLVLAVLRRGAPRARRVLLGDRWQGIYAFKDADARFLTHAHRLFPHDAAKGHLALSVNVSFRITHPMAAFINHVMLGHPRMEAQKDGKPVTYLCCNAFDAHTRLVPLVMEHLAQGGAAQDIFVLASSIRKPNLPVKQLENELVRRGVPCYAATSDDQTIHDDVLRGKVVFSTIHQAKGRERPIVLLYGFDAGHFDFFAKDAPRDVCPESLYVAVTRASRQLVLVHHEGNKPLPFLKMPLSLMAQQPYVSAKLSQRCKESVQRECGDHRSTSVTDLVKFIKSDAVQALEALTRALFREVEPVGPVIDMPAKVCTDTDADAWEEVSNLNGLAVTAWWEAKHASGGLTTLHAACYAVDANHPAARLVSAIALPCACVADALYLANVYEAVTGGFLFKTKQLPRYDWLSADMAQECVAVLDRRVGDAADGLEFEVVLKGKKDEDWVVYESPAYGNVRLAGRVDALTDDTLWEFKCTKGLSLEHLLQVVAYAWMWREGMQASRGRRAVRLLNVCTGQVLLLDDVASPLVDETMELLLHNKYGTKPRLSDAEFVGECQRWVV